MLDTCIILNGPPNCGKDTLGAILVEYGFVKHAMKDQLYIDTAKEFGVNLYELVRRASDRELKEEPWLELTLPESDSLSRILSPREALIHTSENIIKPTQGDDYFGLAAAEACRVAGDPLVVFTDGGFQAEIAPLLKTFHSVVVFRLQREGCSFEGDSRKYLQGFENTYDLLLVTGDTHTPIQDILDYLEEVRERQVS